jgi:hypothetical protein
MKMRKHSKLLSAGTFGAEINNNCQGCKKSWRDGESDAV